MSGKANDKHSSTDDWTDAILAIAEIGTYTIVPTCPVYCSTGTAIDLSDPTGYTIYAIGSPTLPTAAAAGPVCAELLATTALSTVLRPTGFQAVEAATETTISARTISSPIQGALAAYNTIINTTPFSATTAIRCRLPACGGGGRFLRRIPP
ncbi:hypothetical protein SprV_0200614300 [Sparganum proliferum]